MLVIKKKGIDQRKRNQNYVFKDINKKRSQDPLINLYQIDGEKKIPLKKEVIVLIKRLLYNVEEFYQLKDMIKEIMKKDESDNNVNEFFENLLTEVRYEQAMLIEQPA
jgi:hypothetical protein